MIVASRQKLSQARTTFDLKVDDTVIPCVSTTTILGVHFDNVLSWNVHIKNVHSKVAKNLYLLQNIKRYLPLEARKLFYNSYILPHFDYCCVIWGNCSQTLMNSLEKLQKRAARIILDKDYYDYMIRSSDLFSELNWMPIKDRIHFNRAIEVYKSLNGLHSQGLENLFTYCCDIHSHNTRSANKFSLYFDHKHSKSFSHLGATVWSNIPPTIRSAVSLASFKSRYLSYYFSKPSV